MRGGGAVGQGEGAPRHRGLVQVIEPRLGPLGPASSPAEQLKAAVEANVRWSMKQLAEPPEGKRALRAKRIEMVGAVYELETGRVRFLE